MKVRGKEVNINSNQNYIVKLGTVNNNNPKCIYFNIKGWATPTNDLELDYSKIVKVLNKRIKAALHESLDTSRFMGDLMLVDTDLRDSGIRFGKKSYFNCEVTLYQKDIQLFHNLPSEVGKLTQHLIQETLEPFEYFSFTRKK